MTDIKDEFDEAYDLEGPIDILDASEDDAPVIKFVNSMIFRAVKEKASDIHVEPYEKEMIIRFRIDGVLYDILRQPKRAHAAVTSRIKVMGVLDIAEKRMPQDGRIKIKLAGKDIDIRLSTIPTAHGERAVMRILEQTEQRDARARAARILRQTRWSNSTMLLNKNLRHYARDRPYRFRQIDHALRCRFQDQQARCKHHHG